MQTIHIVTLIYLIIGSILDIRSKVLPRRYLLSGAALALGLAGYQGMQSGIGAVWNLLGALPGLMLLALAWITQEQIGGGDGICVMIVGVLIGTPLIYLVLMTAFLFSSICAAGLLVTGKGTRDSRMPWLPFLTAGFAISLWTFGGAI